MSSEAEQNLFVLRIAVARVLNHSIKGKDGRHSVSNTDYAMLKYAYIDTNNPAGIKALVEAVKLAATLPDHLCTCQGMFEPACKICRIREASATALAAVEKGGEG